MDSGNNETYTSLKKWHAGDPEALDALIRRHLPWLETQVRQRLSDMHRKSGETLDYVQDVMVQFFRFGPKFTISNNGSLRALLLKIAENALHDRYDWVTARRRDLAKERPLPSDTVLSLDPARDPVKTPSHYADRNEREAWIRLGMEFLDPEDREILILRQWDKLSFAEIGARFDLAENAARMRHNRAVERLGDKIWYLRSGRLNRLLKDG